MTSTSAARGTIAAASIVLAGVLGLFLFAALEADATSRVDTIFLATLSGAVLLPVAILLRRDPLALAGAVLALCTVVWIVHPGPTRGAAVSFLLVGTLALGAAEVFKLRSSGLHYGATVSLGLAIQLYLSVPHLLSPSLDAGELIKLIALAVVGALTTAYLTQKWQSYLPSIGVAAALSLGSGWTLPIVLALLTVAAGELLEDGTVNRRFSGAVLGGAVAVAWVYAPSLSLLVLLGGLVPLAERKLWLLSSILIVASVGAVALPSGAGWPESLSRLAGLTLLIPAAFVPGLRRPRRVFLSLVLALVGLHLLTAAEALVVPLMLLPAAIPERSAERRLQVVWSGGLLAGTLLLAGYPWLRELPLASFLDWIGLSMDWTSAATILGLILIAGALVRWAHGVGLCRERAAGFTGLLLLGVGIVSGIPQPGVRLLGDTVLALDSESGAALLDGFDPLPISEVVVDSYLADSIGLPLGAGVAELRLAGDAGNCDTWTLEAGHHTGEWAAGRPDVAARPDVLAPSPWVSWFTTDRFMARRYRATHLLEVPCTATRLSIMRSQDLPAKVAISVFNVELR